MKRVTLSGLLVASVVIAFPAVAQEASANYVPSAPFTASEQARSGDMSGGNYDSWRHMDLEFTGKSIETGVAALQAGKFSRAESIFADLLRQTRNNANANFYMGVTRMSLGKWTDAKKHLEIAADKIPGEPDPKSRLGVTYAKLGDTANANAQRAELVKMADACNNACELAPYITRGIRMIDEALAQPPASASTTKPA